MLEFTSFQDTIMFHKRGRFGLEKVQNSEINVKVVLDLLELNPNNIDAENLITKDEIELNSTYSWGTEAYLAVKDNKYLLGTVPTLIEFIEREI